MKPVPQLLPTDRFAFSPQQNQLANQVKQT